MHGLTPRLHGSPTCLPGPSLLYCDHGPRSPSSLSAAVTSGTGRAALFLPSNALVSRVSPRCGYDMPQQRRRRCRASQGTKKGRRPRRRPRLKLSDRAGPDQWPVPGENALFPAQIAGFLAVSRPVPVYPVFLNYVVPVQEKSQKKSGCSGSMFCLLMVQRSLPQSSWKRISETLRMQPFGCL